MIASVEHVNVLHSFLCRDVTLTPPPSYRSTQKPHPVVNKLNAHLALSSRTKTPVMAASNFDAFSIPGQILSSFTHFAQPPTHVIRDNKPRVSNNFLNYQIEQPFSNGFTGHLIPSGHFISKNHFPNAVRYPQNSISSVYSPHAQHTVHLKHPSSQLQPLQQQIGNNNQHFSAQQPQYEKPKEQQHLTETFYSQSISHENSHGNSNPEADDQKQFVESQDSSKKEGAYLPPLPSVPPSVLSPFFQHVQQQQQQQFSTSTTTTTEASNQPKDQNHFPNAFDLYNSNQDVQYSNFKALENEYTHNLVPPPYKHKETSQFRDKTPSSSASSYLDVEQIKALDILNKYNIPAISPLQDSNRYAYNSRPVPSTEIPNIRPTEHQYGTSPSFTTEKPNIFQNLNRPGESEYKQHKLMHPAYTGSKRPLQIHSTNQPFLPTPHSHDFAITHSFFTIEDAVTLSPKHSYRPILPTNTDQIEEILRKPAEEEITEVITLAPVDNDLQDIVKVTSPLPTFDTSTKLKGRGNKIRRRKPKPSTEANDDSQGQWETVKIDNKQNGKDTPNRHAQYNEAKVEDSPKDEQSENVGNFNRNRFRGRPSSTVSTIENDGNEKSTRGRRPFNRNRQRTSSPSTPTGDPSHTNEHIATDFNSVLSSNNFKYRRPSTTIQTFAGPSGQENVYKDVGATDPVISEIQTHQPMRTRVYTTAMENHNFHHDSTEPIPVESIEGHPEENSVVISTKAAFNDITMTNAPVSDTTIHYRQNTFPVDDDDVITTQNSPSTTTATSTTTKISEDSVEKTGLDHIRHRQRLRYKEKLKDVYSSTASTSSTTEIPVDKIIQDNEVTDNRVNVRLPMVTSSSKGNIDEEAVTTPTLSTSKLNRLNSINKFDSRNRPRFSVKDYRQRLSTSTTTEQSPSTAESTTLASTRLRFPTRTRLLPDLKKSVEKIPKSQDTVKSSDESLDKPDASQETTEVSSESTRKRFSPKDRYSSRVKSTETPTTTTNRPATRSRGSSTRRDFSNKSRHTSTTTPLPIERTVSRSPTIRNATYPLRRPQNVSLRQRIQNHHKTTKEPTSSNEVDSQTDSMSIENKSDEISTEDYKHETAIMKIAKDDHSYRPYKASDEMNYNDSVNDLNGSPSEQSERVAELAIFDNNFNSVHTGSASRRIPGYFTIATEDPILPIEAFFPQVKRD